MNKRKYLVDDNFFSVIDTEQKAYWLGFITADGCLYHKKNSNSKMIEIGLKIEDIDHLEKFTQDIQTNYPITTRNNISCNIKIVSKKLFADLEKFGLTERKSKTVNPIDENMIPKHLLHHYLRGIFDGDGGFTIHDKYVTFAVNFCGTPSLCRFFLDNLDCNHINLAYKEGVNDFAQVRIKGNKQSLRVANMLYKDASVYLNRKFDMYQRLEALNEINDTLNEIGELEFAIKSAMMTEMLRNGYTGKEIAQHFDCAETNVARYVRDYRQGISNEKEQQILKLVDQGIANKSEIHRITGFSRDYIRKVFKKVN